ncbi:hypothetical protein BJ973_009212 [Actinoplanes tereljensis]
MTLALAFVGDLRPPARPGAAVIEIFRVTAG